MHFRDIHRRHFLSEIECKIDSYFVINSACSHTCVRQVSITGSDSGLSPVRRQHIIGNNAGLLLIWILRENISKIFIKILIFYSAKCRPFCLDLNVLNERKLHIMMREEDAARFPPVESPDKTPVISE